MSDNELYYKFHLFIAKNDFASEQARNNFQQLCKDHLPEKNYEVKITDIQEDFAAILKNGVLITPTLKAVIIPKGQPPMKPVTIIGTLTNTDRVLAALLINE
jgi:hypothetical protein